MSPERIASTIGMVGSPLIVVSELIKNAVDVSAEVIDVYYDFDQKAILVHNDKSGFALEDIENLANPGESSKKIEGNIKNRKGMYLTGSKGLGILSAFSISSLIEIETVIQNGDIYLIRLSKKGLVESEKLNKRANDFYTKIKVCNVELDVLNLLSSESELKKLRHNCTYLYKKDKVPFPKIYLHRTGQESCEVNFECEIPDMLYDLTFSFEKNSQTLSFRCSSPSKDINNAQIIINEFSNKNLKDILRDNYEIGESINTRTNDGPNYNDFVNVPSFEGRILVYEKNLAGEQLKTYGSGVNIYINEYALYNYLSEENDWLGLADFTQRKKNTRLKPHNVFGYVNFPEFDENIEELRVSNERAGFIEDITFKKLMFLLKAVVMFIVLNIDIADKNPKYKVQKENVSLSSNNEKGVDEEGSVDAGNKSEMCSKQTGNDSKTKEDDTKETKNQDYKPGDNYVYYKPKSNAQKSFCFTNQDKSVVEALKNRDDISNKIYGLIYELANLDYNKYRYATACLYRALIESSSKFFIDSNSALTYHNNDLEQNVKDILNCFGNRYRNSGSPTDKQVKAWRKIMVKDKFLDILNEYVHNETPIDMYQLSESWNTVKSYILSCIS